jgi:hypothetical protein
VISGIRYDNEFSYGNELFIYPIFSSLFKPNNSLEHNPKGYFTDDASVDLATMREGIKLSRKLAESESFAKYKGAELYPGTHIQTDSEIDKYIRDVSTNSNLYPFLGKDF